MTSVGGGTGKMGVEQNKAVVRDFLAAISKSRWVEVAGLMTGDATWWMGGPDKVGKLAWLAGMQGLFGQTDGPMRLKIGDITAEYDQVAVEAKFHMTFKGGAIVYENEYHFLFHFRNGLICAGKEYCDYQKGTHLLEELKPPRI
jgi:uncharacterized protein